MLQKTRKSLIRPGALPPVTVLDITTRDKDGGLIGRPAGGRTKWGWRLPSPSGSPPRPPATTAARARRRSPAWATAFSRRSSPRPIAAVGLYGPHHRDPRQAPPARAPASSRMRPVAAGGCCRSSGAATEMLIDPDDKGDAKDGDLVEVEVARRHAQLRAAARGFFRSSARSLPEKA